MAFSSKQQPYNNIFPQNMAKKSIGTMLLTPQIDSNSLKNQSC